MLWRGALGRELGRILDVRVILTALGANALGLLFPEIPALRLVADLLVRPRQRVVSDCVRSHALRPHLLQQLHGPLWLLALGVATDQSSVGEDLSRATIHQSLAEQLFGA